MTKVRIHSVSGKDSLSGLENFTFYVFTWPFFRACGESEGRRGRGRGTEHEPVLAL